MMLRSAARTALLLLGVSSAPGGSRVGSARPAAPALSRVASAAARVRWRRTMPGIETGELTLQIDAVARVAPVPGLAQVRVIVARIEPSRFSWTLDRARDPGAAWRIADAPRAAALALNGGQFTDEGPWGWVVHTGHEYQAPGHGPLSAALVVDAAGGVDVVDARALDTARAALAAGRVREAIQSYPALLTGNGDLPVALRTPDGGVDLEHRDARLAVGVTGDGRLVVALTRFDPPHLLPGRAGSVMSDALGEVPIGLTVPESAALMRALGCRRAVLLDGGLSAQLLVRPPSAPPRAWPGLRAVPIGLVAVPRGADPGHRVR